MTITAETPARRLARNLGLSGSWQLVTRQALREQRLPPGFYFLQWRDRAIIWDEREEGSTLLAAYSANDHGVWKGSFLGVYYQWRDLLLRDVEFANWDGSFALMELVPSPPPWGEP
jgi:hypothetical protein